MKTSMTRRKTLQLTLAAAGSIAVASPQAQALADPPKRRVVVWFDGPGPREVYPKGMSRAVGDALAALEGWDVVPLTYADARPGPPADLLNTTDVLIWWGKWHHDKVSDELVGLIVGRVKAGQMGCIVVHSGFAGKPFKALMGTSCAWKTGAVDDSSVKLIVKDPAHPIAKGIKDFTLARSERFTEPFDVPKPQTVIFDGLFTLPDGTTQASRQGLTWQVDKGRVFYFQPGHETYPNFLQEQVQQILRNAVEWAAPQP